MKTYYKLDQDDLRVIVHNWFFEKHGKAPEKIDIRCEKQYIGPQEYETHVASAEVIYENK